MFKKVKAFTLCKEGTRLHCTSLKTPASAPQAWRLGYTVHIHRYQSVFWYLRLCRTLLFILWIRSWPKLLDEIHFQAGDSSSEQKNDKHCNIHLVGLKDLQDSSGQHGWSKIQDCDDPLNMRSRHYNHGIGCNGEKMPPWDPPWIASLPSADFPPPASASWLLK